MLIGDETNLNNCRRIVKNCIRCKQCLERIESTHVHEFIMCACGKVGVDGGHEYLRRLGSLEDYEELSVLKSEQ